MNCALLLKIIRVLKILLTIDDPEIVKITIESLVEELEEVGHTTQE